MTSSLEQARAGVLPRPGATLTGIRPRAISATDCEIRATQRLLPAVPLFSIDKPTNRLIPWRLSSNSTFPWAAACFS